MAQARTVPLRGYRRVFRIERRIFRFDRWRIPYPHGVPLRGIGYFVALELCVLAASGLPALGGLLGLANPVAAYLGLPLAGAFALTRGRIDGRPPHHALVSLLRYALAPRCLAGLAPCPRVGQEVAPVPEAAVAYDSREAFLVKGRVRGPARITFRYPSTVQAQAPPWRRDPQARRARARRYRVRRHQGAPPMLRGKVLRVPRGREVVIE
jgi:hypothetical protein